MVQIVIMITLMTVPYDRHELKAQLLPRWCRVKEGSLKFKSGVVSFKLALELLTDSKWRDLPHTAFANLGYVPGSVYRPPTDGQIAWFLTRYGPLGFGIGAGDVSAERTTTLLEPEGTSYSLESFYDVQRRLRRAWDTGNPQVFTDPFSAGVRYWPLDVKVQRGSLVIEVKSCLDYIKLLLARDLADGHAKRCENEMCSAPYFSAQRSDVMFCTHSCAVLVNVKRYRAGQRKIHRRKR